MPLVTLNDGNVIPQLGFGLFRVPPDEAYDVVRRAIDVGFRHFDTATSYGNEAGLGRALRASGVPRNEFFITTKLWNADHARVLSALELSLGNLGLEQLDLYLIHWPAPGLGLYPEAWQAFVDMQARGLTRSIGVSNFHAAHLQRIMASSHVVPAVNQIELHPSFGQCEIVALNDSLGIRTQAWSPLGQGQDLRESAVEKLARTYGRSPAQVILRWHIQKGYIIFPKSVRRDRMIDNMNIFDFTLSSDDVAALDGMDRGNRVGSNPDVLNRVDL